MGLSPRRDEAPGPARTSFNFIVAPSLHLTRRGQPSLALVGIRGRDLVAIVGGQEEFHLTLPLTLAHGPAGHLAHAGRLHTHSLRDPRSPYPSVFTLSPPRCPWQLHDSSEARRPHWDLHSLPGDSSSLAAAPTPEVRTTEVWVGLTLLDDGQGSEKQKWEQAQVPFAKGRGVQMGVRG